MDAVFEGYGKNFGDLKYDTPDYNKLAALEKNVLKFSAAKDSAMRADLTKALRDGDRTRTFAEFKQEAQKILTEYKLHHLKTEYNAAVAGAQMASKWVDVEKAAKINPKGAKGVLLEYRTMEDSRVRPEHASLNRTILPADHPFWKTWTPPNGWGCRCTIVRLNKGKVTPDKDIVYPEKLPPKMYQQNLAQKGDALPITGQQFPGIPKTILAHAETLIPHERRFNRVIEHKNGGYVDIHADYKPNPKDHKLLLEIAHEKAKEGHRVELLPKIDKATDPGRKTTLAGAIEGKNPDLRINGEYVEVKSPTSHKKVITRIHEAADQADIAIINLPHPHKIGKKMVEEIFKNKPDLKYFELREKGKYTRFSREDYKK